MNEDLDDLYHILLKWDYFKDLREEEVFVDHIEEDQIWEMLFNKKVKHQELENIPLTFSSSDEYMRAFFTLFLIEIRAQITKSKCTEKEHAEKFTLNLVENNPKRKFFNFELLKMEENTDVNANINTENKGKNADKKKRVNYTNGDLILIHKKPENEIGFLEHTLAIVDKFSNNNIILCRVELDTEIQRCSVLANSLIKNSEWLITKICNMATINREYQALMNFDELNLKDLLLNPGIEMDRCVDNDNYSIYSSYMTKERYKQLVEENYFNIPKRLDVALSSKFNRSQYHAIKNSIKKKGITLIQGPPGTGKSTTILGILSIILNSTVLKEQPQRKNSILDQVSNEMMLIEQEENEGKLGKKAGKRTKNQESDVGKLYVKTHPWLFDPNPYQSFDEIDFDIEDMWNFKSFEKCVVKELRKPETQNIAPPNKILVCAPSNVAIDEIVRKLANIGLYDGNGEIFKPKFVRVGPNYNPNLKEYSLEYLINQYLSGASKLPDLVKTSSNESFQNKANSSSNEKNIDKIKLEILSNVKIVCTTLSMAGSNLLTTTNLKFDTVVVDEASQAVELSTLIPMKYNCERLILVGDPNQLNATVFSSIALKYKYDQSLFFRCQEAGHPKLMLKTQYRMHPEVSNFISELFYDNELENDESVYKMQKELIENNPMFSPMTFYDIESEVKFANNSYYNLEQIYIVVELIKKLKEIYKNDFKTLNNKVAVLSPYSKQVSELTFYLKKVIQDPNGNTIEVNTVDGFQGKEKSIIIFCTVRSKENKTLGFLSDQRRINGGLTRAKNCLIVVGDSKVLIKDKNWEKLVKYSFKKGAFYKVKGNIKKYFDNFEKDHKKYQAKNEEQFIKLVFPGATGKVIEDFNEKYELQ